MKQIRWQVIAAISLILLALIIHAIQYLIYQDLRNIGFYFFESLAFLPIEILLVTLIIDRLMAFREKREMMRKLNMVIGAFFSEIGKTLLSEVSALSQDPNGIKGDLLVRDKWTEQDFEKAIGHVQGHEPRIKATPEDLKRLKKQLEKKQGFFLGMLENPTLLEHETFTDLLLAVSHLTEELEYRKDLAVLLKSDIEHLEGDIKRAYKLLAFEWLVYLRYLKTDYPYLFSLALRTNPLDPKARPEVVK